MVAVFFIFSTSVHAETLRLSQFLDQVREKHQGIKGSALASEGSLDRSAAGRLLLIPSFFIDGKRLWDNGSSVLIRYNQLKQDTVSVGFSEQTPWGVQGKVYYDLNHYVYTGLTTTSVPANYYEARPTAEASVSLWRNFFGKETQAEFDLAQSDALATHYQETYAMMASLIDAEVQYWKFALAQERVLVQQDAVDRSKKIHDWNVRRVKDHLADASDEYQARAAHESNLLKLQLAMDQERVEARAFNLARGISSDHVPEQLQELAQEQIMRLMPPNRADKRVDVKAAEQQIISAQADAKLSIEHATPLFEAYGSASLGGRTANSSEVVSESFSAGHPSYVLGVRLVAPLAFISGPKVRDGLRKEIAGYDLKYQRKLLEQESDWENITQKFKEAKNRYLVLKKIEKIQLQKFQHEQDRLKRGRTTTYQVIQFQQEYSQSQLNRMEGEAEVLSLFAQMKLFGESS